MYFLFLVKKPIVYVWLVAFYFIFYAIQYSTVKIFYNTVDTLHFWISALILTLAFHRLFLYFCMGYFAIFHSNLSIRGISLKTFENWFKTGVFIYIALSFFTIFFTILFAIGGYYFFWMSIMTAIYEKLFLYAAKWTAIYQLAQKGVTLSQNDFQEAINEARQIFLSNFAKSEVEG